MEWEECPSLVSVEWLQKRLGNVHENVDTKRILILDVSWSSTENMEDKYILGHIPGAQYLNIMDAEHTELLPRNIPTREKFREMACKIGLTLDTHVVLYSNSNANGFFMSCRAWWTFKVYGHPCVSILDGGWQKWVSSGGNIETDAPQVQQAREEYVTGATKHMITTLDSVLNGIQENNIQIVDSRPANSYKAGHIKSSKNFPMSEIVDASTGTMKSVELLKDELLKQNIDLEKPLVTHCGSGMSACSLAFVSHICGCQDVKVFHGGFTEWKAKAPEDFIVKEEM